MEKENLINLTKEIANETGIKENAIKILLIKNKEYGISFEETRKFIRKLKIQKKYAVRYAVQEIFIDISKIS